MSEPFYLTEGRGYWPDDEGQDGALDREEIVEVSAALRRLKEDLGTQTD